MKNILQYKPITRIAKKGLNTIQRLWKLALSQIKESYQKNAKRTILIGVIVILALSFLGYLIYRHYNPKRLATIPYPFQELETTYLTSTTTTTWDLGVLNGALRKIPNKIGSYYTQVKPFSSLQKEQTLDKIIETLGFSENVRQYATEDNITFQEEGKSLNMNLVGSYINYAIGLNVDESVLKEPNTISLVNRTETANLFLSTFNLFPDNVDTTKPEMFFAKMERLGLVEVSDPSYADVTAYEYKAILNSYEIEPGMLNTYIIISNSGKVLSVRSNNKEFIQQVNSPLKSSSEIRKALLNNEGILFETLDEDFKTPQSIVLKDISLLYYYNESNSYVSPVYKGTVTITQDDKTIDATVYLPAYKDAYYTYIPRYVEEVKYAG